MFWCRRTVLLAVKLSPCTSKPFTTRYLTLSQVDTLKIPGMVRVQSSDCETGISSSLSIIRDHINAGHVNEAVQAAVSFLKENPQGYLPPKILKLFSDIGELQVVAASMKRKLALNAAEGSEFAWLLKQFGLDDVRQRISTDHADKSVLNEVLEDLAEKLLGVQYTTAIDIIQAHSGLAAAEVQGQGVLVETVSDIRGDIQSSSVYVDGTVTAAIVTYTGTRTTVDQLRQPATDLKLKSRMHPQKYVVLFENGTRSLLPSHLTDEHSTRFLRSRIVGISSRTCRCPNCDRQIAPLGLTETDKAHIRSKLGNLQAFGAWLRGREEFEFIVDGANVARFGNMYEFSYSKIESVVDHLTGLGKRVLVILPRPPASAKMTPEIDRIVQKLSEADMLYEAPPGQKDDHYWLYATVYEGRSRPAFVVSNDYMRDHHDIFPDMKAFMRWRSHHVVYYKLTDAASPVGRVAGAKGRSQMPPRKVELFLPEKLPREIQRTGDSWHVPIVDRDAWLCVNLGGPQIGNSVQQDRFDHTAALVTEAGSATQGMQPLRDRSARRPAAELMFLGQHGDKKQDNRHTAKSKPRDEGRAKKTTQK